MEEVLVPEIGVLLTLRELVNVGIKMQLRNRYRLRCLWGSNGHPSLCMYLQTAT